MSKLIQYDFEKTSVSSHQCTQKRLSNILNPSLRVLTFADSLQNNSLKSDRKETVQKRLKTTVIKLLTLRSRGSKVFTSPSKIKGTLNKLKTRNYFRNLLPKRILKKV